MPQMKVGHLRAIPAPSLDVVTKLGEIGRELTKRNEGISPEEQAEIDRVVATGFALTSDELLRMRQDSSRWTAKNDKSTNDDAPKKGARSGKSGQ